MPSPYINPTVYSILNAQKTWEDLLMGSYVMMVIKLVPNAIFKDGLLLCIDLMCFTFLFRHCYLIVQVFRFCALKSCIQIQWLVQQKEDHEIPQRKEKHTFTPFLSYTYTHRHARYKSCFYWTQTSNTWKRVLEWTSMIGSYN